MSQSIAGRPSAALNVPEEMANHGITHSIVDVFHVDGFRYSNLSDAIAQAKRTRRARGIRAGSDWHTW